MNSYPNDERIKEKHKLEFKYRGWTQIDLGLSKKLIEILLGMIVYLLLSSLTIQRQHKVR